MMKQRWIMLAAALVFAINTSAQKIQNVKSPSPSEATFSDSRDGKKYKRVKIGTQVWMAENLNYNARGSKCYGEDGKVILEMDKEYNPIKTKTLSNGEIQVNCVKYGRLYSWDTARRACPTGFHLPTDKEWTALTDYVGGENIAGTKLKSSQYWDSYSGVPKGTDQYGFSALPGGFGIPGGYFIDVGNYGHWWSATESDASNVRSRHMYYNNEIVYRDYYDKAYLYSVRCLQD